MKFQTNGGSLCKFYNCQVLRNHQFTNEDLWVRDGKIVNPEKVFFDEKSCPEKIFDCRGSMLVPGFIDLQINGGFGIDFTQNASKENIDFVSKGLLQHGVTAYCPTLVTSPSAVYKTALPYFEKRTGGLKGAAVLGAHIEGPFINPIKKGAHPHQFMKDFSEGVNALTEVLGGLENVAIITLAPEIPGAFDVIEHLTKRGIVVSLGHSAASIAEGEGAINRGASLITHLFNAMLPFHHRDPGLVGLLASDNILKSKTLYYGIIADGVHTHPAALRIAHKTHPEGLVLVTDAVSALGFEEGTHRIGQMDIEIRNGCAVIAGTDTLCGSIATMNESVRFFKNATGCTAIEAIEAATLHPAKAMGIQNRKGTLAFEADADFLLLDDDLRVQSTWISGECVWSSTSC